MLPQTKGTRACMRRLLGFGMAACAAIAIAQEAPAGEQDGARQQQPIPYQNVTPEQRASSTRAFLGLGAVPDKAAAELGAPIYRQTCAFCHGPQARGATGPSLITSDEVLGDDHGEKLVEFLKSGRPEKGMPAYATMTDTQLRDIAEFLHVQVEEVANRGAYKVPNILVGDAARGRVFVAAHCMQCHPAKVFAHIASRFRSPEQLQRGWVWPAYESDNSLAATVTVKTPREGTVTGRVTQVSDFRITVVDGAGKAHTIERGPGVKVERNDPLAAHRKMIQTLANSDMHDVTAYLETLK